MVKVWVLQRGKLKQVEIRKKPKSSEYYYYGKPRDYNLTKKRKKVGRPKKVIKGREIGRRIIKKRIEKPLKEVKIRKGRIPKKKTKKIDKVFEKKVSKTIIKNFLDVPTNEINLKYKPLLKAVLNKKELGDFASDDVLNAMIKQENINKIKWRFEIRADVYDRDGTKVLQMIRGSGGDLMSLKESMRKGVWRGASVDYDLDVGNGYVFKLVNKGNVDRVEVTIIFRS